MSAPYILAIEDDPDVCLIVTETLTQEGYRVVCRSNGEGMALALHDPPVLILLDLLMPGMSGWEVRRRLLAYSPTADIPVVLMTAVANSRRWQADLRTQGQLDKPFALQDLIDQVRALIGSAVPTPEEPPRSAP